MGQTAFRSTRSSWLCVLDHWGSARGTQRLAPGSSASAATEQDPGALSGAGYCCLFVQAANTKILTSTNSHQSSHCTKSHSKAKLSPTSYYLWFGGFYLLGVLSRQCKAICMMQFGNLQIPYAQFVICPDIITYAKMGGGYMDALSLSSPVVEPQ